MVHSQCLKPINKILWVVKSGVETIDAEQICIERVGEKAIAANYSTTIGITTKTGVMEYYSRLFYVEFYNHTGSGNMGRVF